MQLKVSRIIDCDRLSFGFCDRSAMKNVELCHVAEHVVLGSPESLPLSRRSYRSFVVLFIFTINEEISEREEPRSNDFLFHAGGSCVITSLSQHSNDGRVSYSIL